MTNGITGHRSIIKELNCLKCDLKTKNLELDELNTTLRVLLKKNEEAKKELEQCILHKVKDSIDPLIRKLRNSNLDENQRLYLGELESNIREIISPFSGQLSSKYSFLTFCELRIANLIREGKSSKEIAETLKVSVRTVDTHRRRIRIKFDLVNKKKDLRSHLLSIE